MKQKNTYNGKGITLIALVITIIILLILAGVSIAMLSGEGGILKKAKSAESVTEEQQAREKLELVLSDLAIEKRTNSDYNETQYMDEKLKNQGMLIIKDVVVVDGWYFEIDRTVPKIIKNIGNIPLKSAWEKLIDQGFEPEQIVEEESMLIQVLKEEYDINYILENTKEIMPIIVNSKVAMEYIANRKDICDKIFGNTEQNISVNTTWVNAILNNSNAIAGLDASNPITVPNMTDYMQPSGEAKASSTYNTLSNSSEYAWKVFNSSLDTDQDCWHSNEGQTLPQWVQYKFDQPVFVYKFYLQNRKQDTTWVNAPKDFILLGSNDEINWDTLGTYQNTSFQKLMGKTYVVKNINKRYLYYRINVLTAKRTDGTTDVPYTAIGRIQFYGK